MGLSPRARAIGLVLAATFPAGYSRCSPMVDRTKKLSREQLRELEKSERRGEPLAASAVTLLEIAMLVDGGRVPLNAPLNALFDQLRANPVFEDLPLTFEIAAEVAALGPALRDPMDRVIVATARAS